MMLKIISKQKKIFHELLDERCEKITNLNKKVNSNDLIYKCKGNIADVNFNQFDNVLDITDKIRDGKIDLADVKNNQERFQSYLGEIKKGIKNINQKCKKILCTILKCSIDQKTKLLKFMMIILQ